MDVEGQCVEVLDTNGANIVSLLHHQTRDSLVVMSSGYNIGYYQADPNNGKLVEITRVHFSFFLLYIVNIKSITFFNNVIGF